MASLQHMQQHQLSSRRQRQQHICQCSSRRPVVAAAAAAPAPAAARAAALIDGKKIAEDIRKEIAAEVQQLQQTAGRAPGLAVVLVGGRKDSETYVRAKKKACTEVSSSYISCWSRSSAGSRIEGQQHHLRQRPASPGPLNSPLPLTSPKAAADPFCLPACLHSAASTRLDPIQFDSTWLNLAVHRLGLRALARTCLRMRHRRSC